MKRIILLCFFGVLVASCFAQKEVFDIVTYNPPTGWTKKSTPDIISYSSINQKSGTWGQVGIIRSTASKGSIEKDFESEWQEFVVKVYSPTGEPQISAVEEAEGWKTKTGIAKFSFNNSDAIAILKTTTGFGRCVSIIATINSVDYLDTLETLISSIELKKPDTLIAQKPVGTSSVSIAGTWGFGNNAMMANNRYGPWNYTKQQYTFHTNGTYSFVRKIYQEYDLETLLTRESGTYVTNGTTVTVTPNKNVIEAWSKKNGGDNFNKLIKTQTLAVEKSSYSFSIYYDEFLKVTVLMLQASTETKRDGKYNAEVENRKMWRYMQAPSYIVIKLPGE